VATSADALPRGVLSVHALPASHHDGPWDSIVTPAGTKERLLGTAVLTLRHGRRLSAVGAPPIGNPRYQNLLNARRETCAA
jgi:hypothetical protein